MNQLIPEQLRSFISESRLCRVATVTSSGKPCLAPFAYAYDGEDTIYIGLGSPERVTLKNVRKNPEAAILIDIYPPNWRDSKAFFMRGKAEVLTSGSEYEKGCKLRQYKYPESTKPKYLMAVKPLKIKYWGI